MLSFDWDPLKDAENKRKHGISFAAASVALEDPYAIEEVDRIADGELRLVTTGMAAGLVVVLVCHTNTILEEDGAEIARIISARKASTGERRAYDEQRTQNGRRSSNF